MNPNIAALRSVSPQHKAIMAARPAPEDELAALVKARFQLLMGGFTWEDVDERHPLPHQCAGGPFHG